MEAWFSASAKEQGIRAAIKNLLVMLKESTSPYRCEQWSEENLGVLREGMAGAADDFGPRRTVRINGMDAKIPHLNPMKHRVKKAKAWAERILTALRMEAPGMDAELMTLHSDMTPECIACTIVHRALGINS